MNRRLPCNNKMSMHEFKIWQEIWWPDRLRDRSLSEAPGRIGLHSCRQGADDHILKT